MKDLIDRQAAIDFIDAGRLCNPNEPRWSDNEIVNFLKSLPSAQPERRKGKGRWNAYYHGEESGKSIFSYSCNQCGYSAPYNLIGGVYEQRRWNFCPNCGAQMDGGEHE